MSKKDIRKNDREDIKTIELSNNGKVVVKKHSEMPRVQIFKGDGQQLTQPVAYPRFRKNIYIKLCSMEISKQEVVKTLDTLDSIINPLI
ncbi:MAG: hypothetical protein ACRDDL_00040 [Sarcina sp.]